MEKTLGRRIKTLMLFLLIGQLVVYAQGKQVSVNLKNATLKELFTNIESQSSYRFSYRSVAIDNGKDITINEQNSSVGVILNTVLSPRGLQYEIVSDKSIVISLAPPVSGIESVQINELTGTVVDQTGEAIIGASIIIKGSNQGTITDFDGKYRLKDVSPNSVIVFSYLGYLPQERTVGNNDIIDIVMEENTAQLDEVVIVGYGVQKKVNLTGSIASINADEIKDIPAASLSNALSGRLAGVLITQKAGKPGGSSDMSVRAKGTWNDAAPLYVIDGIVRDQFAFDGLDMSEIDNLSVLKDGASAAIYGARSANGVILVTTKKGKMGKPLISYTGSIGISDATKIPKTQNAYNQAKFINDNLTVDKVDPSDMRYYSADELEYFKHNNANWLDEAWKEPIMTRHSVNVSGGSEAVRYFVGGSFFSETGSFDNLSFKKYNIT